MNVVLPVVPRAPIAIGIEYRLSNPGAFMRAERIENGEIQGVIYTRTGRRISDAASWDLITHRLIGYTPKSSQDSGFNFSAFDLSDAVPRAPEKDESRTAADVLSEMAATHRERAETYGDSFAMLGEVMSRLYPDGVALMTADDHRKWHLFEMIVVKICRFAASQLTHVDSIHDIGVYAAILEHNLRQGSPPVVSLKEVTDQ